MRGGLLASVLHVSWGPFPRARSPAPAQTIASTLPASRLRDRLPAGVPPETGAGGHAMASRWLAPAVFALAALTLCAGLGSLPLTQPDEGRNALVAAEMQASGRWLVPTLGAVDYLDKPAFFFKLVGAALGIFGRSEGAARLPSAVAALALVGATWAFAQRLRGRRAALLAALALSTMPLFIGFARLVIFDMVLTLFVCLSIFAGHLAEASPPVSRRRWYLAGSAAAALATLVKGPVGFVLPALAHFVSARVNGRTGAVRRAFAPVNVAIFLALVLPWLVGVSLASDDFLYYGLVHETLARFTTESFQRNQPAWFYLAILGAGALPWTLLLPGTLLALWRRRPALHPFDRLCVTWSLVVVAFFTLSRSKQPAYVLSVCVPLALVTGAVLDAALTKPRGAAARALWSAVIALGLITASGAAVAAFLYAFPALLGRLPGPTDAGGLLWLPVLPAVVIVCATFVVAVIAARIRRRTAMAIACLALLLPSLLAVTSSSFTAYAEARSSRVLARALLRLPAVTEVACLRCFPSALPFYLGRPVTLVSDDASELRSNYVIFRIARDGALPQAVVSTARLPAWLAERGGPVYLLADEDGQQALGAIAAARGVAVTQIAPRYWAALLPPAVER